MIAARPKLPSTTSLWERTLSHQVFFCLCLIVFQLFCCTQKDSWSEVENLYLWIICTLTPKIRSEWTDDASCKPDQEECAARFCVQCPLVSENKVASVTKLLVDHANYPLNKILVWHTKERKAKTASRYSGIEGQTQLYEKLSSVENVAFTGAIQHADVPTNSTKQMHNCSSSVSNHSSGECPGKLSFYDKVTMTFYFKAAKKINFVAHFVIFPAGIITNTISFFVLNMKENRKLTACNYLSITAVTDNCILIRKILTDIFVLFEVYAFSGHACKAYLYFQYTFAGFSTYTVVLMTWERFCAVVYPHKTNIQCTKEKVIKFTSLNAFIVCAFYTPLIFVTDSVEPPMKNYCSKHSVQDWYIQLYSGLQILFCPIVPVVALFYMNISITIALKQSTVTSTVSHRDRRVQHKQITIMLLLVSFTFMLLSMPFEIRHFVSILYKPKRTVTAVARDMFSLQLTLDMMMLSHVINFYLYLLSGSKFRNNLKTLFHCGKSENPVQMTKDRAVENEAKTVTGRKQEPKLNIDGKNIC